MGVAVERTAEAILIKLPLETPAQDIQNVLNYFEYTRLVDASNATVEEINALAKEAKAGWWEKNKDRFRGVEGMAHLYEEE